MVSVGDIIEGIVETKTDFGVFVDVNGQTYLILLHEMSWSTLNSPTQIANVGDRVRFKVIHLRDPNGTERRLGSIKQAYPEDNPWKNPSIYSVNSRFNGKIHGIADWGVFVEHPAGARGVMHISDYEKSFAPVVGQSFDFEIIKCDFEGQRFQVRLAPGDAG